MSRILLVIFTVAIWAFVIRAAANYLVENSPTPESIIDSSFPLSNIKASTVKISSYNEYIATAFFVKSDSDGSYAITNRHFCIESEVKDAGKAYYYPIMTYYAVYATVNNRNVRGFITSVDENADLCLVYFPSLQNVSKIDKFAEVSPEYGTKTMTYGYPGFLFGKPALYEGRMGQTVFVSDYFHQIFFMSVAPGQSGSGIFDKSGTLVGIIHMKVINLKDTGAAVPIAVVNRFLCREIKVACKESL